MRRENSNGTGEYTIEMTEIDEQKWLEFEKALFREI